MVTLSGVSTRFDGKMKVRTAVARNHFRWWGPDVKLSIIKMGFFFFHIYAILTIKKKVHKVIYYYVSKNIVNRDFSFIHKKSLINNPPI